MVTIISSHGFRIVIYLNDHEPAHVHAISADGEAKIDVLGSAGVPQLVWAVGLKKSAVRRAMNLVEEHRQLLLARWSDIHGKPDRR